MAATPVTPWRSPAPGRPAVPLPPAHMPLLRGRRPLKRWRYVGVFGPDVMLCAANARVGPVPQSWWAVWDRGTRTLAEDTSRGSGGVHVERGRVRVQSGSVRIDLELDEGEGVETVSPHGREYIWTRKQGGVPARGEVVVGDRRIAVDARAVVDESAGYHARVTDWMWSAGVGVAASGAQVAWNLVTGVHDDPAASERTVWVDGEPHHVAPVRFAADLARIDFEAGDPLTFSSEAVRARRERMVVVSSEYEQPFGTFAGALPVAGPLREGRGVMERHHVRW